MFTGTQFRGTLPAHATQRWFTFNWPATGHVIQLASWAGLNQMDATSLQVRDERGIAYHMNTCRPVRARRELGHRRGPRPAISDRG